MNGLGRVLPAIFLTFLGGMIPFAAAGELSVTYLGNEGFLLEGGGRTVIIDGLYRGLRGYVAPSEEQRRLREEAVAPFDSVDLVLATHHHDDHFHPETAGRHLDSNAKAELVTTLPAVERLRSHFDGFSAIEPRVHAVEPAVGEPVQMTFDGIDLLIYDLHHGQRTPAVPNLGFVFTLEGVTFLHVGDTEASPAEIRAADLHEAGIDVAFVPYWHLTNAAAAVAYREALGNPTVIAMHIPAPDAPSQYFTPGSDLEDLLDLLEAAAPGVIVAHQVGRRVPLPSLH
jgi:L-ascorbate metabolism protein UlaG (beta-lactamase superfamily)